MMADPDEMASRDGVDYTQPQASDPISGKPRRHLHLWLGIGVLVLAGPLLLYQALRQDQRDRDSARQAQTQRKQAEIRTPASLAPVQSAMREQTEAAMTPPAGASYPVPLPERPPDSLERGPGAFLDRGPLGGRAPGPAPRVADPVGWSAATSDADPGAVRRMQLEAEEQQQRAAALASSIVALSGNSANGPGAAPLGVVTRVSGVATPQDADLAEPLPGSAGMLAGGQELLHAMSVPQPRGAAPDALAASSTQEVQEAVAAGMARLPPTSAQQNRRWLDDQATAEPRTPLRPVPLSSPFTLFEGTVIPAVLITEVNSDLPGLVSAQVTQDVYDGVSGEQLLIPKGTRLVGEYNGELRPGQARVLAAFSRLIYPSGASVSLLGMPAADAQGRAGLEDQVDNHFFRIFGRSFIVAGLAWALQRNGNPSTVVVVPGTGTGGTLTGAAGQVLVDTARAILDRDKVIPPTIVIRQGHKFNLMVQRDMVLPPSATR